MSRIVLAVALLVLGAEAARADDDFKTCASGPPDYAIMACTNLIEGGKLDSRQQAIAYTNWGVAFRNRGGLNRALADLNRAIELAADQAPKARFSAASPEPPALLCCLGLDKTGGVSERTGHKLKHKQPCRIDRPWQHDLPTRHRNEAEPVIIWQVANEHDEAEALRSRACDPLTGKRLAEAIAFVCRVHDERTEEKSFSLPANVQGGEANTANEPAVEPARQAQRRHRRHALTDAVGSAREAARSEGLRRKLRKRGLVAHDFIADLKA